ncbi:OmpA family protein [Treponema brennaborense]|uniref:OmpA/MotB domain protein n=1 Tax=Treponema brennaborense (strain DSM 12168 / CIP 105900 / DD5/3) TaxID=906968 RepID=F4LJ44_TREBD|nr:OmpA family protein [Treponema brennaborense]AEE16301.1 OmpA/MotB domain protein [Treponema brennaborense DSM 12168]
MILKRTVSPAARLHRLCCTVFIFCCISRVCIAQSVSSESFVDWTQESFTSLLGIDLQQAGIPFPSGKNTAVNKINIQLPLLLKDPLLSLTVDSSLKLGDLVLSGTLTFDTISAVINDARKTPGVFSQTGMVLNMQHAIRLNDLSALLIRHSRPYTVREPIERVSSRPYSGIIIDARGTLPVHGEFVKEQGEPCFFPKIWDENMNLLYERNMMDSDAAKAHGIVEYGYSDDELLYQDRVGKDPLYVKALRIYGMYRTDPVISRSDALKILSVPQNVELLRQGRIVLLLDEAQLVRAVGAPLKDDAYYVVMRDVAQFVYENKVPDVTITDDYTGIQISIQNLQFIADSAELLPAEKLRLDTIAELLKTVTADNEFSVIVEGHTASVGKPAGEQQLSIERAQAIISAMAQRGVDTGTFTSKGFGGTVPVGDNATPEGRAQNRRVEILIVPKTTYIQRDWGGQGSQLQKTTIE